MFPPLASDLASRLPQNLLCSANCTAAARSLTCTTINLPTWPLHLVASLSASLSIVGVICMVVMAARAHRLNERGVLIVISLSVYDMLYAANLLVVGIAYEAIGSDDAVCSPISSVYAAPSLGIDAAPIKEVGFFDITLGNVARGWTVVVALEIASNALRKQSRCCTFPVWAWHIVLWVVSIAVTATLSYLNFTLPCFERWRTMDVGRITAAHHIGCWLGNGIQRVLFVNVPVIICFLASCAAFFVADCQLARSTTPPSEATLTTPRQSAPSSLMSRVLDPRGGSNASDQAPPSPAAVAAFAAAAQGQGGGRRVTRPLSVRRRLNRGFRLYLFAFCLSHTPSLVRNLYVFSRFGLCVDPHCAFGIVLAFVEAFALPLGGFLNVVAFWLDGRLPVSSGSGTGCCGCGVSLGLGCCGDDAKLPLASSGKASVAFLESDRRSSGAASREWRQQQQRIAAERNLELLRALYIAIQVELPDLGRVAHRRITTYIRRTVPTCDIGYMLGGEEGDAHMVRQSRSFFCDTLQEVVDELGYTSSSRSSSRTVSDESYGNTFDFEFSGGGLNGPEWDPPATPLVGS